MAVTFAPASVSKVFSIIRPSIAAAKRTGYDVKAALAGLLEAAQRAGEVRADVDGDDVKALIAGCVARDASTDPDARRRMVEIATQGLRA